VLDIAYLLDDIQINYFLGRLAGLQSNAIKSCRSRK